MVSVHDPYSCKEEVDAVTAKERRYLDIRIAGSPEIRQSESSDDHAITQDWQSPQGNKWWDGRMVHSCRLLSWTTQHEQSIIDANLFLFRHNRFRMNAEFNAGPTIINRIRRALLRKAPRRRGLSKLLHSKRLRSRAFRPESHPLETIHSEELNSEGLNSEGLHSEGPHLKDSKFYPQYSYADPYSS